MFSAEALLTDWLSLLVVECSGVCFNRCQQCCNSTLVADLVGGCYHDELAPADTESRFDSLSQCPAPIRMYI
jgi:hypothetical protein